uniref:Uncharacterized protein n=1 Tax=Anopheles atroparvus TaxID=41427 RepID=A0A182IWQ3_ANOAO
MCDSTERDAVPQQQDGEVIRNYCDDKIVFHCMPANEGADAVIILQSVHIIQIHGPVNLRRHRTRAILPLLLRLRIHRLLPLQLLEEFSFRTPPTNRTPETEGETPNSSSTCDTMASVSSSSPSSSIASSIASLIISSFMSIISDCFSNSCKIFCICGRFSWRFMLVIAFVTPFMASPIAFCDFSVWIFSETA